MPLCQACNKEIIFAQNPQTGKFIPLQKVQTYEIEEIPGEYAEVPPLRQAVKVERDIFISHFLTCPKASQFSGGKR